MTLQSSWTRITQGSDLQAAGLLQANTSGSDQKWQKRNQSVRVTLTLNQKYGIPASAQAAGPALQSALLTPCTLKQAAIPQLRKATAIVKPLLMTCPAEP